MSRLSAPAHLFGLRAFGAVVRTTLLSIAWGRFIKSPYLKGMKSMAKAGITNFFVMPIGK